MLLKCNAFFIEKTANACYINFPNIFFYIKTNIQNETQRVDAISAGK